MKINTINKQEIEKFSKMSDEWWNPEGKFKPLQKFKQIRIEYIKNCIINHFNIKNRTQPLKNLNVLDIGCGGGLLSEPMCKMGADVTGLDASEKNINIAKIHSRQPLLLNEDQLSDWLGGDYVVTDKVSKDIKIYHQRF